MFSLNILNPRSPRTRRLQMTQQRVSSILILAVIIGCGNSKLSPPISSLADVPHTEATPAAAPLVVGSEPHVAQLAIPDSTLAEQSEDNHIVAHAQKQVQPQPHTVRKVETAPPLRREIPPVVLTTAHAELCKVGVGDQFPAINLPKLGAGPTDVFSLSGVKATVVLYWNPDRWMALTALADLQRDIASKIDSKQVAVVGIAVRQPAAALQTALRTAKASFPQLLDAEGKAIAAVGTVSLPRIYVLDPAGKIVWFDIEYSEGTRRELGWALEVLTRSDDAPQS